MDEKKDEKEDENDDANKDENDDEYDPGRFSVHLSCRCLFSINISLPHFIQSLAIFILIKKSHERNKSSFVFGMIPDRISVQAIFISFIVCLCLPPTLGSTKPVFLGNWNCKCDAREQLK